MSETPKPIPIRLGDLLEAWQEDAEAANEAYRTGAARGPITAFPKLDEALGGCLAPGLHILHGVPGSGKTAFALQVAATCGCPAVFVTCEMAPLELLRRLAARETSTYLGRFKSGELTPAESLEKARRAAAAAPDFWFLDATVCYPYRADIEAVATAARGDGRYVLIVVDSVHSWAQGAPGELTEYESLNAHLQMLNDLALALNAPVLAVAERNRQSMNKGGMSAGAGTRKLEYEAGTVMDLDKDKDATEDPITREVPIKLKIAKNRNGATGKPIPLRFHGALQTFNEDRD